MTTIAIFFFIAATVLAIVYLYMAAFSSWYVSKSDGFEPIQKYAQYAIIWLIPIIGAALVLHILAPNMQRRGPEWIPWIDYLLLANFVSSVDAASGHAVSETPDTHSDDSASGSGVDN